MSAAASSSSSSQSVSRAISFPSSPVQPPSGNPENREIQLLNPDADLLKNLQTSCLERHRETSRLIDTVAIVIGATTVVFAGLATTFITVVTIPPLAAATLTLCAAASTFELTRYIGNQFRNDNHYKDIAPHLASGTPFVQFANQRQIALTMETVTPAYVTFNRIQAQQITTVRRQEVPSDFKEIDALREKLDQLRQQRPSQRRDNDAPPS